MCHLNNMSLWRKYLRRILNWTLVFFHCS